MSETITIKIPVLVGRNKQISSWFMLNEKGKEVHDTGILYDDIPCDIPSVLIYIEATIPHEELFKNHDIKGRILEKEL